MMPPAVFWLIAIAAMLANAAIFYVRGERYAREEPQLAAGYQKFARGFALWLVPVCAIYAIGAATGLSGFEVPGRGTPRPFDYFAGAVNAAVILRGAYWVLFQRGAEFLALHSRVLNGGVRWPAAAFKVLAPLFAIGTLYGITISLFQSR